LPDILESAKKDLLSGSQNNPRFSKISTALKAKIIDMMMDDLSSQPDFIGNYQKSSLIDSLS